jgi:hypothetical protein
MTLYGTSIGVWVVDGNDVGVWTVFVVGAVIFPHRFAAPGSCEFRMACGVNTRPNAAFRSSSRYGFTSADGSLMTI